MSIRSASILAPGHVVQMPNVEYETTAHCVPARSVSRAMHSRDATLYLVSLEKTGISSKSVHNRFYFVAPPPVIEKEEYRNPCVPSPCGQNAECRDINGSPSCSCLPTYLGSPPNCRPECTVNSDCPSHQACIRQKCMDPCPGSCGVGALCNVLNHTPICTCPAGYTGDPFTICNPAPPPPRRKK